MLNKTKQKTAQFLRHDFGRVVYGAVLIATPVTLGVLGGDYITDDFNDQTTPESQKVEREYTQDLISMMALNSHVKDIRITMHNADTPEAFEQFKEREMELSEKLTSQWDKYTSSILTDDRLSEAGYHGIREKSERLRDQANLKNYLWRHDNSWDECKYTTDQASEMQNCMKDRQPGWEMLIFGSLIFVGWIPSLICAPDSKKLADKLEKSIKQKAPKN